MTNYVYLIGLLMGVALLAYALVETKAADDTVRNPRNIPMAVLATVGIIALAALWVGKVELPWGWNWMTILFSLTIALFAGIATQRPLICAAFLVSAGALVWLGLGTSPWVFVLAIVAAIFVALDAITLRSLFAALATASLFIAALVGVNTVDISRSPFTAAMMEKALAGQLTANNGNAAFVSWDEYCKDVPADNSSQRSVDCRLHKEFTELKKQVDKITTDITTLNGQTTKVTEVTNNKGTVIKSEGGSADDQAVKALADELTKAGWGPDDIRINNISTADHTYQAGTNKFIPTGLVTKADLVMYLNSKDEAASANRTQLLKAVPAAQHDRLLSGDGFYAVQFMQDSCLDGNSYYENGKVKLAGLLCHKAGDVLFIYVGNDGVVYWGATVRADCGNGHLNTAPAPKKSPKAAVCPPDTDRAGQMIGSGCNIPDKPKKPNKPKLTTPPTTTPPTTPPTTTPKPTPKPTPPTTTPPKTTPKPTPPKTTPKPTPPKTTPKPTPPKTTVPKTGSNPGLTSGTKESNTVNNNDGSKDSQGKQDDPSGDAEKAKQEADAANKAKQEAADKAKSETSTDSGVDDEPQGSTSTGSNSGSDSGSTGSAGEDTSGSVWGN